MVIQLERQTMRLICTSQNKTKPVVSRNWNLVLEPGPWISKQNTATAADIVMFILVIPMQKTA